MKSLFKWAVGLLSFGCMAASCLAAPTVAGIKTLSPTVSGGKMATGEVWLSQNVAVNTSVQLTSSDPTNAIVSSFTTVQGGTNYSYFSISTKPIGLAENVTLTGTLNASSKQCTLTINPPPIAGIKTPQTSTIVGGTSTVGEIWFNQNLTTSATVNVTSSMTSVIPNPGGILVSGGSNYAVFNIASSQVTSATVVTVGCNFGGNSVACNILVNPLPLAGIKVNPTSVPAGQATLAEVWVGKNVTSDTVVQLSTDDLNTNVQSTVTIPAGRSYAYFYVYTSGASSSSFTLTATLEPTQVSCNVTVTR